ncbi:MAG: hypothetical protein HQ582_18715 [Planctomycetes bacterium]|nr:hypothetical protein [Planctomycetota bacterium]
MGDDDFVVLEPQGWVGKRFPLLKYIDIGDRLARGKWVVVMYRHDCSECQSAVEKCEILGRQLANQRNAATVALIEMPPHHGPDDAMAPPDSVISIGRLLAHDKQWFLATPVEVSLDGGVVASLSKGRG